MKKSLLFAMVALGCATMGQAQERISDAVVRDVKVNDNVVLVGNEKVAYTVAEKATGVAKAKAPKKAEGEVEAYYRRPRGTFFKSGSTVGYGSYAPGLIGPALKAITFENMSTNATSYEWSFQMFDFEAGARVWNQSDAEEQPLMYYIESDSVPQLTASNGTASSKYFMNGTYNGTLYSGNIATCGNYNVDGFTNDTYGEYYAAASQHTLRPNNPVLSSWADYSYASIGVSGETGTTWFGKNGKGYNHMAVGFEKPEHTYVIKKIAMRATVQSTADATLKVEIYKVLAQPTEETEWQPLLGDLIASGTAVVPAQATSGNVWINFPLTETEDGLSYEVTPEIDSDIVVVVSGYDAEAFTSFSCPITTDNTPDTYVHAGYLGGLTADNELVLISIQHFFSGLELHNAPCIFMDVENPYLMWNYTNEDGYFDAPTAGGSEEVEIFSYKASDEFTTLTTDEEELPEWLTVDYTDGVQDGEFTGLVTAKFTAAALPAETTGRTCRVKMMYPGVSLEYLVSQGNTGVSAVVTSAAKVAVVGGNFVVTAPEAVSAASVYNALGQLVASQAIEGETTINAENLAKGVYVVKFNDGTSVKVAK